MDVVGHIVQKYILFLCMCIVEEQMQLFRRSETVVRFDIAHRPISVVSRERTYGSSLVPQAPSIFWVLCDWADPKRVGMERIKISIGQFLAQSLDISSLIVGTRVHGRVLNGLIVSRVAVEESVHHREIHDGSVPIFTVQLLCITNHLTKLQRDQPIPALLAVSCGIQSDPGTFPFLGICRNSNA